jgi:hypothetical protein
VTTRISQVSYRLKLPTRAHIHDVLHESLLKKFEGVAPSEVPQLLQLLHDKVIPSLKRVMRACLRRGVRELLVKWQGRSEADTTWEQLEYFKRRFAEVELEDKLFGGEGGGGRECSRLFHWKAIPSLT